MHVPTTWNIKEALESDELRPIDITRFFFFCFRHYIENQKARVRGTAS